MFSQGYCIRNKAKIKEVGTNEMNIMLNIVKEKFHNLRH